MDLTKRPGLAFLAGVGLASLAGCGQPSSPSDDAGASRETVAAPAPQQVALDASCDRQLAEKTMVQCKVCHTTQENQPNTTGPNLWGIYGKVTGSAENFAYSPALKEKGVHWDDVTLDAFLESPQQYVSGTRMAFGGIKNPEARAAAICYLKALTRKS